MTSTPLIQRPTGLLVVGGGNMASAIVRGGLDAGVLAAARVVVCEPDEGKRRKFEGWGCRATEVPERAWYLACSTRAMDGDGGEVLLAVKPQSLAGVAAGFGPVLARAPWRVVVQSILAGVPTTRLGAIFPGAGIVRLMPNTPAQIGLSMTALCLGAGSTLAESDLAERLFAAIGKVVRIEEGLMDAYTAVVGSGPAYVCYLAEAMTRAAIGLGFEPAMADAMVRQTVRGTAGLLEASSDTPAQLRAQVTSKGGTTAAAVGVLDSEDADETMVRAITAARDRARELGKS